MAKSKALKYLLAIELGNEPDCKLEPSGEMDVESPI